MKIRLILKNDLGDFESNIMDIDQDQYSNMLEVFKSFYTSGFEMDLEYGFMVVAPEVVRRSILIIKKIEEENGNQEKV